MHSLQDARLAWLSKQGNPRQPPPCQQLLSCKRSANAADACIRAATAHRGGTVTAATRARAAKAHTRATARGTDCPSCLTLRARADPSTREATWRFTGRTGKQRRCRISMLSWLPPKIPTLRCMATQRSAVIGLPTAQEGAARGSITAPQRAETVLIMGGSGASPAAGPLPPATRRRAQTGRTPPCGAAGSAAPAAGSVLRGLFLQG